MYVMCRILCNTFLSDLERGKAQAAPNQHFYFHVGRMSILGVKNRTKCKKVNISRKWAIGWNIVLTLNVHTKTNLYICLKQIQRNIQLMTQNINICIKLQENYKFSENETTFSLTCTQWQTQTSLINLLLLY